MASEVPKESSTPGTFPETPATEPDAFSVKPIPASSGIGNPSEPVTGDVSSGVKLDKESYEKADAGPAGAGLAQKELAEATPSAFINSAGGSTTAGLAGEVPKEPTGVPEVVKDSQEKADVSPEASANPEAVEEKKEVEDQLKQAVPKEPVTSDGSFSASNVAGIVTGTAAAATAAVTGAAFAAKGKATEFASSASKSLGVAPETIATSVPEPVKESIEAAHTSPEATTNAEAVEEKKAVEAELEKKISPSEATGEPAPTITAAATPVHHVETGEVSPLSKPGETKTDSAPAEVASTPAKDDAKDESVQPTPESTMAKKDKRRSFFGKLKEKLKGHSSKPKSTPE
jgi:hypothetical protein